MRFPWRQARLLVYLMIVAGLFLVRGRVRWESLFPGSSPGAGDTLVVAGRDLAPGLVDRLVAFYQRDYPRLTIVVGGGGTNRALEDLINRQADVAFLVRPPRAEEQRLFRSADGDTVLWFSVALGGIAFLAEESSRPARLTEQDLDKLARGEAPPGFPRVYVPDPNRGLWDALQASRGSPARDPQAGSGIVFLKDEAEILAALRADPGALGVASTLALPEPLPSGVVMVRVGDASGKAVLPTYENIGLGEYPVTHALYASCRNRGDIQGAKFVTHLTGARGQRQIEKAGCVPALLYLREVVLTTHPMGN
jgi:ABC-type phosphate transport system substrate-binding protein